MKNKIIKIIETMPEDKFQKFFEALPSRVKLLIKSGMVNWREVLPEWYEKMFFKVKGEKEWREYW